MLKVEQPDPKQTELLERFVSVGGVLDFLLVGFSGQEEAVPKNLHANAVCEAMTELDRRRHEYGRKLLDQGHIDMGRLANYGYTFDCGRMAGAKISLREFLGDQYDFGRGRCVLRGTGNQHCNEYFVAGDEQSAQTRYKFGQSWFEQERAYVYAFSEPPYSLRLQPIETDRLFHDLTHAWLGELDDRLEIFQWTTDWSGYFDEGHDWWGAFAWSLRAPGAGRIAVVMGSTTN